MRKFLLVAAACSVAFSASAQRVINRVQDIPDTPSTTPSDGFTLVYQGGTTNRWVWAPSGGSVSGLTNPLNADLQVGSYGITNNAEGIGIAVKANEISFFGTADFSNSTNLVVGLGSDAVQIRGVNGSNNGIIDHPLDTGDLKIRSFESGDTSGDLYLNDVAGGDVFIGESGGTDNVTINGTITAPDLAATLDGSVAEDDYVVVELASGALAKMTFLEFIQEVQTNSWSFSTMNITGDLTVGGLAFSGPSDVQDLIDNGSTGSGPFVRQANATITSLTLDTLAVDEFTLPLMSTNPVAPASGYLRFFAKSSDKLPYSIDELGTVTGLSGGGSGTTNATAIWVTNSSPAAYTPADNFVEGHLQGIDDALAALGAWSPLVYDTSTNTVTPIYTNSVTADETRYSTARILATQQTNSAHFLVSAVANNTGGSLVVVTNTIERLTNAATANWNAYFAASGANLLLNAVGPSDSDVSWKIISFDTWTHTNHLASTSPYLFEDYFATATIDSSIWTTQVGSSISSSATDPLDGTYSFLSTDPSSGAEYITSKDVGADYATLYFGFLINISTPSTSNRNIIRIRNSADDADLGEIDVSSSRQFSVTPSGGSQSTYSTGVIPNTAGQSVAMVIAYTRGTGSNATMTAKISTDGTTWTDVKTSSNGTSTEYPRRIMFINNSAWNMSIRADRVIAKTSEPTPDEIINGL